MNKNTWLLFGALGIVAGGCVNSGKTPTLYGTSTSAAVTNANTSTAVLPFVVNEVSDDETYGYTAENPVRVGGGRTAGARNQLRYLNALKGPQGQPITYERQASCCAFRTRRAEVDNVGLLDVYKVSWAGKPTPVTLYINMYRGGKLMAPQGFTAAR